MGAVRFPSIKSAVNPRESRRLVELARGKRVLEIGSQYGYSAVLMALNGATVHAVDWHRGDAIVGHRESLAPMWQNVNTYGVADRVIIHIGSSRDILPLLVPGSFGFAFHDSYHSTENVLADVALILPLLRPGAKLAFHDYGRYGVAAAVDSLGLERVSLTDSLVVLKVPA
jgi:predicted O-methyltransferase YrrM